MLHCREQVDGKVKMMALREAGSFVGTAEEFDKDFRGVWPFDGRAKGRVSARFLAFNRFLALSAKHPMLEADGRAGGFHAHTAMCIAGPSLMHMTTMSLIAELVCCQ